MSARLGPAPPAQGADLIVRAVGAVALANLAITPLPGLPTAPPAQGYELPHEASNRRRPSR
jgi:hypothetical protein